MRLDGTAALVSGGASGLGRATAIALAGRGVSVVLADLPHSDGERVAAELEGARFIPVDITEEDGVKEAVAAAAELGSLRAVVNCAGVAHIGKLVGRDGPHSLDAFERTLRINLVGTFNVVRLAAAEMIRNEPVEGERGVIVNTASIAAFEGQIGQAAYSASKGGIVALTLPLARELASSLIRVATIAPGLFRTPMMDSLPKAAQQSLGAQVPHPSRLGAPAEYAALVTHILENPMINGEVIRLDGAVRMASR